MFKVKGLLMNCSRHCHWQYQCSDWWELEISLHLVLIITCWMSLVFAPSVHSWALSKCEALQKGCWGQWATKIHTSSEWIKIRDRREEKIDLVALKYKCERKNSPKLVLVTFLVTHKSIERKNISFSQRIRPGGRPVVSHACEIDWARVNSFAHA